MITSLKGIVLPVLLGAQILVFTFYRSFGQDFSEDKYQFAKEVFQSGKYKRSEFPLFKDKITLVENGYYLFGKKVINVELDDKQFQEIFIRGLFNPDIIFGEIASSHVDSTVSNRAFHDVIRNDSLTICCLEQLELLNTNVQTKRFLFWKFGKSVLNPTECYFELINERADENTSIKDFISGSRMTFFCEGTMIF